MTPTWVQLTYLACAVCFILALKGLSGPKTARSGNLVGAAGAVVATALSGGQLTFQVPAFATMKGWDYSGQLLRVGGVFNFVSPRYQLSGIVTMVPPVPPPSPAR